MGFGKLMLGSYDIDQAGTSLDFGPVGRLTAALLAEYVSPGLAAKFATSQHVMSPEGFQTDYRPLLPTDKLAGALICRAAQLLPDLEDGEIRQLGQACWETTVKCWFWPSDICANTGTTICGTCCRLFLTRCGPRDCRKSLQNRSPACWRGPCRLPRLRRPPRSHRRPRQR